MKGDFVGAGWAFPLDVNANGTVAMASGPRKLEQAMRLILMTYPGERPMRPRFGSRLRDFIFAGATEETAAQIEHEVRAALFQWEPRVDIDEVIVTLDDQAAGTLWIDIHYTIKATNDERNLVFPFYTIPELGEPGEMVPPQQPQEPPAVAAPAMAGTPATEAGTVR